MEQVLGSKRVMQQSIFADQTAAMPEPDVIPTAGTSRTSQLLAYGLPGAALLIALIALAVAILK
jgi:hypothetical protein